MTRRWFQSLSGPDQRGRRRTTATEPARGNASRRIWIAVLALVLAIVAADIAQAHHILGRPADSLDAASNTPPDSHVEAEIGDYVVTYMVFPAFPQPQSPGRINLYLARTDDGTPFAGEVTFKVRGDSWLSYLGLGGGDKTLGRRPHDDAVFRQGFEFDDAGDYIVTVEFRSGDEPYVIEFPLRVGETSMFGPIGLLVGAFLIVLLAVSLIQRRRSMTGKIRASHEN
jgi:hypothetical protein